MSRFLYVEPFAGASGDMLLGALVGLGFPLEELHKSIEQLGLKDWKIEHQTTDRAGLAASRIVVSTPPEAHGRHLPEILDLLQRSAFPLAVTEPACRVFNRLAEAEAEVHGCSVDEIHFHEVGAADALIDVVGVVAGLHFLKVERVYCGRFPVGEGEVVCQHGRMPNPAPATFALLRGWPLRSVDSDQELVTPTGAALLTSLAQPGRPTGSYRLDQTCLGAGGRELEFPNVVRASLGRLEGSEGWETLAVLESHLDDSTGELLGFLMERLFEAGALEVSFEPVLMKKNRPGQRLFCLCRPHLSQTLTRLILTESSTLGVRRSMVERFALERRAVVVRTDYGKIEVKRAIDPEGRIRVTPEFDQARELALAYQVPLTVIFQAARTAFWEGMIENGSKS